MRAADWSTAHSVLVTQLAPRWWCAGQFGQLQTHLKQLEAEAGAVEAAVGSAAWKCGALLYSAFFEVEASLPEFQPAPVPKSICLSMCSCLD